MDGRTLQSAAGERSLRLVVAACAASAGAHAALVPQHLEHEPRLGVAFIAAAALLLFVIAALTYRGSVTSAAGAALTFAALIGAYAVNVTAGLPGLSSAPEAVDAVAGATKAVEALGLACSSQLIRTLSGRGPLGQQEVST
jgi:hypothetical protein